MNKTWLIIEKTIGLLLGLWGIVALYGVTETIADMLNTGYASVNHLTLGTLLVKNHLTLLLALGSLFSGFLLMSGNREGWLFSIVCCIMYLITFYQSSMLNAADTSKPYNTFFKSYSLVALLFFCITIVLLLKPFWKKYHPTSRQLMWPTAVLIILLLDKLVL